MFNEVAKILGDNLNSNTSMVLFADKKITLAAVSDTRFTGDIQISENFETQAEAESKLNEIVSYLDERAKSCVVTYRPTADASALGLVGDQKIYGFYARNGYCSQQLSNPIGTTLTSTQAQLTVKVNADNTFSIYLNVVVDILPS